MNLIAKIKSDRIAAKKNGEQEKAEILTTLLSEVERMEKADRDDDKKVIAVVKKYLKGLEDMISSLALNPMESVDDRMKFNEIAFEQETVMVYLPEQLEGEALTAAVEEAIKESGAESPRDMGKVMKLLKEKYEGNYDGREASEVVKKVLIGG